MLMRALLLGRMAAYLANAAALARTQWTQFSPGAVLAGIGLFAAALVLHLRFARAAATHGSALRPATAAGVGRRAHAGCTLKAAPLACQVALSTRLAACAAPAQQQPVLHMLLRQRHATEAGRTARVRSALSRACALLTGMEWAALAAVLACGAAVFSANAVMAEGLFVTAMLVLLTLALALHHAPAPAALQLPQPLQPSTQADPHPGPQTPDDRPVRRREPFNSASLQPCHSRRTAVCGSRAWPAAGVVLTAAAAALQGLVPRTPTDAMHKAAATAPDGAWPRLAALAARALAPVPMLYPALRAALRALPCAAALAVLLQLQAHLAGREPCAWSARRLTRGAARGALVAAHACAALHLAVADGHPAGQPSACAGPLPSPGLSALPAMLLQLAASLRSAARAVLRLPASGSVEACQGLDIGLLLPQLVYTFSATSMLLCMCHVGLADKCWTSAPLPGFPAPRKSPEPEPCHHDAAAGYLLSGCTAALLAPAVVVLGPGRMLVVVLGLAESACAWTVVCGSSTCRGPAGGLERGRASAAGVLWALLGTQLFFCTGHFCEFAGLQTAAGDMRWPTCSHVIWWCVRSAEHREANMCVAQALWACQTLISGALARFWL